VAANADIYIYIITYIYISARAAQAAPLAHLVVGILYNKKDDTLCWLVSAQFCTMPTDLALLTGSSCTPPSHTHPMPPHYYIYIYIIDERESIACVCHMWAQLC